LMTDGMCACAMAMENASVPIASRLFKQQQQQQQQRQPQPQPQPYLHSPASIQLQGSSGGVLHVFWGHVLYRLTRFLRRIFVTTWAVTLDGHACSCWERWPGSVQACCVSQPCCY
jgi:hypothetical protein